MSTARVAGHGLRVTLPSRWEARLYLRDAPTAVPDRQEVVPNQQGVGRRSLVAALTPAHPAAYGWPGESTNPVLHLANFALPPGRGDFGTGAVERMGPAHAFVALLEYDAEEAGRPLFAARGLPRPGVAEFDPNALQRRLPGQLGCQRFFTERDRPFCLYVVLGSRRHANALLGQVHDALTGIEVGVR